MSPSVLVGGLRFGSTSSEELERILASSRDAEPTYEHVGSPLDPTRWSGPSVLERCRDLGRARPAFEAAREALRTWVAHKGIGASIHPQGQPVEAAATVLVVLRRGPLSVIAPNRIIGVLDEPDRFGFAYGSLPGHPERGEESFVVEHVGDGSVRAAIRVQARTGTLAAQAVAPMVRRMQSLAVDGYLRAIAEHVSASTIQSDQDERPLR